MKRKTSFQLVSKVFSVLCILNFVLTAVGSDGSQVVLAQEATPDTSVTDSLTHALQDDGATIVYDEQSGLAQFISFEEKALSLAQVDPSLSTASLEAAARGFLSIYGSLFGLTGQANELAVKDGSSEGDANYVRFQQSYQGIPILGGELIVALDGGKNIKSALGEVTPNLAIATSPAIDASTAATAAITAVAKWNSVEASTLTASNPELWIYDPSLIGPDAGPVVLVWRTEVSSTDLAPIRELVLVNAQQGGIALHFNQIDSFDGPTQSQEITPTEAPTQMPTETEVATETPTDVIEPTATETATEVVSETLVAPTETPQATETPTLEPTEDANSQLGALAVNWYVAPSPSGNDSNSCADSGAPCATINGAIGKAAAGDTILVAEGLYTGTGTQVVLLNKNLTVSGGWDASFTSQTGFSTIDGQNARRGIINQAVSTIERFVVQHGWENNNGGGISNTGTLTLNFSVVANNEAESRGGGIYNTGTATINSSSISTNQVNGTSTAQGAGIYNSNTLIVNNSTIDHNITKGTTSGGGGIHSGAGSVQLNNTTIARNQSIRNSGLFSSGPGIYRQGGTFTIGNTIIANNTGSAGDCFGVVGSNGYNIIRDTNGCTFTSATGDQLNVDPALGPFINNAVIDVRGFFLLPAGSPAVNAGNPSGCTGSLGVLLTDQRGQSRDSSCDIGAFEYIAPDAASLLLIVSGASQYTAPLQSFTELFQVVAIDINGNPISGMAVTFEAPSTGPSGEFSDTSSSVTLALTAANGVASASVFTANNERGQFSVLASASEIAEPVEFSLENLAWYVTLTGNDSNDCKSPATACLTVSGAVDKASANQIIYVSEGTYYGLGSQVVSINKALTVSGGWNATFDTQSGFSTVDGEGARRGITISTSSGSVYVDKFVVQYGINSGIQISGSATISNSQIHNNTGSNGGGISSGSDTLTLNNTTVSNNTATNNGGGISKGSGFLVLTNSTISGNQLRSVSAVNSIGGGISSGSVTRLYNSTIYGNLSMYRGGGIRADELYTYNSIITGNMAARGADCYLTQVEESAYNIIGLTDDCDFDEVTNLELSSTKLIGPLMGLPGYHPLSNGSLAINGGDPAGCLGSSGSLTIDQRGITRTGACDIGAYESALSGPPAYLMIVDGNKQKTPPYSKFGELLQVVVMDGMGTPISGIEVTFNAPASGPGGLFISTNTVSEVAITDSDGVASISVRANDQTGSYSVSAEAIGIGEQVSFSLNNSGWYISTTGQDTNDCSSAVTACATINGVLAKPAFANGDTILAGTGIFAVSSGDSLATLNHDVRIVGGWGVNFTQQTGFSTFDGQNTRRVITVDPGIEAKLERLVIQNGNAITGHGGGIYNRGMLTLRTVTVQNNSTSQTNSSAGGSGGGIANEMGHLTIEDSTIRNNHAATVAGGLLNSSSWAVLKNSTVSGNSGQSSRHGILNNGALLYLYNSTIAFNSTGIELIGNGTAILSNSILYGVHLETDCNNGDGEIISWGYNLIGKVSESCTFEAAPGDLIGTSANPISPRLTLLQDNGGLTLTHALMEGSPAIDHGNPAVPAIGGSVCLPLDQRGTSRPQGNQCDIGAFEGFVPFSALPLIRTYTANNNDSLPGTFLCDQSQISCTNGSNPDADDAHTYAHDTYNYYAANFGRDGINNSGITIISSVDYCDGSCPYANAFWDGEQMVYGGGSSTSDSLGYSQADDVVAHELTHGVTQFESNLFYYYQSGAINEALSDIFGEFVDQTNGHGNDSAGVKWLMGEDLPTGANRDMEDPPVFNQPDKMSSGLYNESGCHPSAERPFCDNGYVHTNSGVANKAAYLMAQGGTFNGRTVTALGLAKTAAVWYEVQTNLLTSGADYLDLYYALNQACLNLIGGTTGITGADCVEVQDAIKAVEMDQQPGTNYNPEAAFCPGALVPSNIFFDDLESGSGNWTFNNDATTRWQLDMPAAYGAYAYSGLHYLFGNDTPPAASDTNVAMTNAVFIPANAYLHFAHAYGFENDSSVNYDGGVLEYSSNGGAWTDASSLIDTNGYRGAISNSFGNPLPGRQAFVGDSHGYISTRLNLSTKAGQNLRFRWRMGLDSVVVDWGWWIDNVRIYTCVAAVHKPSDFDGDGIADPALYYNNGEWRWLTSASNYTILTTSTAFNTTSATTPQLGNDFDGDGKTDPTLYYPNWGQLYWRLSSTNAQVTFGYFTATAHPVPIAANDYDGDKRSDPALYYPTNGVWSWKNSLNNTDGLAAFNPAGNPTPIANADMNGDGKSDPALFYATTGVFAWNANGVVGTAAFSPDGSPMPFLADFDGDGKSDPALYYRTWALWAWKRSSDGQMSTAAFNPAGSPQPVVGFFDSDNKADAGLYYADLGLWAWKRTTDGGIGTAAYNPGGSPEPQFGNDFDGDGKADPALYYRAWGLWAWKRSSDGQAGLAPYGPNGNPAVIGGLDFDGDGKTDPGLYYRDYGLWAWQKSTDGTIVTKTMTSSGSPQPVR